METTIKVLNRQSVWVAIAPLSATGHTKLQVAGNSKEDAIANLNKALHRN